MDWQEQFEQFWAAWPRRLTERGDRVKLHKTEAKAWFAKHRPDDNTFAEIMAGVEGMKKCVDEQYYPDAFRWLRNERWEDEYDSGQQVKAVVRGPDGLTARERAMKNAGMTP